MKLTYKLITLMILLTVSAKAQWTTVSGGNMYNTNSGYIGIGTTSPSDKLQVNPNGAGGITISTNAGSGGYTGLVMGISAQSGGYSYITGIKSSGGTLGDIILNKDGGYIGIGTTTPTQKLDIVGNIAADGLALSRNNTNRGSIWFANTGDVNHRLYNNEGNIDGEGAFLGIKWNVYGGMRIRTFNGSVLTPAFNIIANGNIGIGTTSPGTSLHIAQSTNVLLKLQSNTGGVGNTSAIDFATTSAAISNARIAAVDVNLYNGALAFYTDGDGVANANVVERMRIMETGNVGIGTTIPGEKFEVSGGYVKATGFKDASGNVMVSSQWTTSGSNLIGTNYDVTISGNARIGGKLLAKGFKITLNPITDAFPDFVFAKDYPLMPLVELEAYIEQHSHLPEVPSAKEVESEGLDVKEMNILLLKKVEEMSLHLIKQEKRIRELERTRK